MHNKHLSSIVLAAGSSRRYGSLKQLARFQGQSLVRRATQLACSLTGSDTVLVVGAEWQSVVDACSPFEGMVARNENYAAGMASSIACGVRSISPDTEAVLILLSDQPLITREHLLALTTLWQESDSSIVASEYANVTGPPAIFPSCFFSHLQELTGDRGARTIIEENAEDVLRLKFADAGADVDTPDDLRSL